MYLKTLVLLSILVMQTSFAGNTQPVPLTEEQKQQVIDELQAYDLNKGLKLKNDAIAAGERPIDVSHCNDQGELKEFCIEYTTEHITVENQHNHQASLGRYSISIYFPNDRNYDLEIVDSSYVGNLEDWDVAIRSREILEYYLGYDYEAYEPKITIVKPEEIGIRLFLTPAELEEIVDESTVHYISTPANSEQKATLNG